MVTSVPSGVTIFVVDTEQNAQNFVREFCAYVTGRVGDFGIGEEFARLYENETGLYPLDNVVNIPTTSGFEEPCSVWPTLGWFTNGASLTPYKENAQMEKTAIEDYRARVIRSQTTIIEYKLELLHEIKSGKVIPGVDQQQLQREIKQHEAIIQTSRTTKRIPKHPAYLSVAIFFKHFSEKGMLDILKVRSMGFVNVWHSQFSGEIITLNSFRVIKPQAQNHGPKQSTH